MNSQGLRKRPVRFLGELFAGELVGGAGEAVKLGGPVEGRVWDWTVPMAELPAVRAAHLISSTLRRGDGMQVRVIAASAPGTGAISRQASLEDAYLHAKANAAKVAA